LIAEFFTKKINERGVKMIKYESVCNSDVFDEIKSGETIFLLDRAANDVRWVNDMSIDSLVKVFKHDNKDNRYEFYKEVKVDESLSV
jgi:hypothetical protein